ncbi:MULTISPECIES: reverse transcriptase domain-containing protein [unclassified Acinetobacter]|uniref:reverse transcriptase domain-containing protein n=1 Tax=unclassified Acinetobacter TaxID=196816 RepID=UPI0015D459E3|nr:MULTISPECIES: reverse transcriptase domain-containing protein [unclassified Acinetobacter]
MTKHIAKNWTKYFEDIGLKDEYIEEYSEVIKKLVGNNVPVIFEIEHLSKLVGINVSTLYSMIFSTEKFYRSFDILQKNGENRRITTPFKSLKKVQKWIYQSILKQGYIHKSAHGFVEKKSIITNASVHKSSKVFLQLDIRKFFPSIPLSWVINYFHKLGYSKKLSFYLAKLCCYKESLAQGAPTSPALSNLIFFGLDKKLNNYAIKNNILYTRYADDMVFSGTEISLNFKNFCIFLIKKYGFKVNSEKTRLKINVNQNIITGVQIKNNNIFAPKKYKRELIQDLYYIKKFGLISHVSKKRIKDPNYVYSLLGKINFVLSIEPENLEFINYKNILKNIIE